MRGVTGMADSIRAAVATVIFGYLKTYRNIKLDEREVRSMAEEWAKHLQGLDPQTIVRSGEYMIRHSKYPTLPALGELRETALRMAGQWLDPAELLRLAKAAIKHNPGGFVSGLKHEHLGEAGLDEGQIGLLEKACWRFGFSNLERELTPWDRQYFERVFRDVQLEVELASFRQDQALEGDEHVYLTPNYSGMASDRTTEVVHRGQE